MNRTGWEHHDLEKEMRGSNMAQLLETFKRESEKLSDKCHEYVKSLGKLTDEGKKEYEDECRLLEEGKAKVALRIAEILTDTKRIQREVNPNR